MARRATVMSHIKRLLGYPRIRPVTTSTVDAAEPEPGRDRQIREARANMVGELLRVDRTAFEVREQMARRALRVVSENRK